MERTQRRDTEGNLLVERVLKDSRKFEIVKNFPKEEEEIRDVLKDIADNVCYKEYPAEGSWNVSYNVRKET